MRDLLSDLIVEAAAASDDFVVLSGDHGYALFDAIRTSHPAQFINVGVAEQSMIGIAAGLARTGYKPLVYGLSSFVPIRVLEQIKIDLCFSRLPVVLIGDGAGLVYSTLGACHQCAEDVACLRALPNIGIWSPCDAHELAACWREAMAWNGPAYIRLGKADRPVVHASPLGDAQPTVIVVPAGTSGHWIAATGSMVRTCAAIARSLGVGCVSIPQLKPFRADPRTLFPAARIVAVVDEHSSRGGLWSTLLESYAETTDRNSEPSPIVRSVALQDDFTHRSGSYQYALSEHDMSDGQLAARLTAMLQH